MKIGNDSSSINSTPSNTTAPDLRSLGFERNRSSPASIVKSLAVGLLLLGGSNARNALEPGSVRRNLLQNTTSNFTESVNANQTQIATECSDVGRMIYSRNIQPMVHRLEKDQSELVKVGGGLLGAGIGLLAIASCTAKREGNNMLPAVMVASSLMMIGSGVGLLSIGPALGHRSQNLQNALNRAGYDLTKIQGLNITNS